MAKFNVRVYLSTFYDVEVEAEDAAEAVAAAESSEYWDNPDLQTNLALQEGASEVTPLDGDITVEVIWDTDGEEDLDLPKQVVIPGFVPADDVSDYLSDNYGYCVESWFKINE